MKIELKIELTLPDDTPLVEGMELQNLYEIIADNYVHYVTNKHLADTMTWMVQMKKDTSNRMAAKTISDHHREWADITKNAKWEISVKE